MGIKISMQREVKERIRKEIIEAAQQYAEEYEIENYTDTASALNCVYAEFKNQFGWKIKQIGEHNAFIEWLKGLPMQFDYSYFDMRERIKYWFNQSNEEASKYSDEQVDKLYWNLLTREFFALVKKFKVTGTIKSEDDVKVTPYDMNDYLDSDNVLEESNIVSNEITSNEIADTIGQAEQINERMWREEVITHDGKRYYITYEFTDEEIAEAKECDDPTQFEDFLPFDKRHVYEIEESKSNIVSNEITSENLKEYKVGQRIRVEFENDFHGTKTTAIATIVRFEGDYWVVELPLATRKRIEKKLCPFSDCRCQKITKAIAIESGKKVLLTY